MTCVSLTCPSWQRTLGHGWRHTGPLLLFDELLGAARVLDLPGCLFDIPRHFQTCQQFDIARTAVDSGFPDARGSVSCTGLNPARLSSARAATSSSTHFATRSFELPSYEHDRAMSNFGTLSAMVMTGREANRTSWSGMSVVISPNRGTSAFSSAATDTCGPEEAC